MALSSVRTVLRSFHLGLDLGQKHDHSALVAVEQSIEFAGEKDRITYEPVCRRRLTVRLAHRIALQTGYNYVVEGVRELMASPELARSNGVTLSYDATGVGAMAADWLRTLKMPGRLFPVVFTSGEFARHENGHYQVPKNLLMVGMMRAFEVDGLRVAPGLDEWASVEEELTGIRRLPGRRFGGEHGARWVSEGEHDDMAMALSLALHGAREMVLPERGDRVRRAVGG
jgi:hypothetical protein